MFLFQSVVVFCLAEQRVSRVVVVVVVVAPVPQLLTD